MNIRKAVMSDVDTIYHLIDIYAKEGKLLERTHASIYENLQSLYVVTVEQEIVGVAGLHILGKNLAEIRSLVVAPEHAGKGIGKQLVNHIMKETAKLEIEQLLSLTYQVEFFKRCGFTIVEKETMPQKVWKDCINCPKFPACDETAMVVYVPQHELVKVVNG
ncbi:N-acetyltransferase [Anaerobacillus sp. MEB173]|uniref:N-acetyltransferase n=1 Tax=Anaerobacillus sp. MEB173 TaxID=3383345 RepID=UPI003F8F8696